MRILVACEESQAVTKELRKLGHEAYSCDIQECSGGKPEWHIQTDVLSILNGNCDFETCDKTKHSVCGRWDMIIAFPPCTHLAVSGALWFEEKRKDGRQRDAVRFFCQVMNADCDRIAVENPVNIISGDYVREQFPDLADEYHLPIKPTQHIQPYYFGNEARKNTCLWLKGLPKLKPTKTVCMGNIMKNGFSLEAGAYYCTDENGKILSWNDPRTAKIRSKTFPGVAKAMAEQWAGNNVRPAYVQESLF